MSFRRRPAGRLLTWVPLTVLRRSREHLCLLREWPTRGVLLTFTNVPIWAKNQWVLASLFITSALTSGIAAISLVLTLTGSGTGRIYEWLERLADGARSRRSRIDGGQCCIPWIHR